MTDNDPYGGLPSLERLEGEVRELAVRSQTGWVGRNWRRLTALGVVLAIGVAVSPGGPAFGGPDDEPATAQADCVNLPTLETDRASRGGVRPPELSATDAEPPFFHCFGSGVDGGPTGPSGPTSKGRPPAAVTPATKATASVLATDWLCRGGTDRKSIGFVEISNCDAVPGEVLDELGYGLDRSGFQPIPVRGWDLYVNEGEVYAGGYRRGDYQATPVPSFNERTGLSAAEDGTRALGGTVFVPHRLIFAGAWSEDFVKAPPPSEQLR